MRKGHNFEQQIDNVLAYIDSIGGHAHKNYPYRTISGQFIKGEPFDYEVFTANYKAVFDAKECSKESWSLQKKDIVQANNLKKCKNAGLNAYFLINFSGEVKQIDIDKVIEILSYNRKSVKKSECSDWELIDKLKNREV